ncbi:MAG: aminotransferase class I/II-fold pyridoxal phosphate-dependent enzyme [Gammaproteobacteria bacterium]|nr:aminotransferase class I/II-fold pyridoxal phosphate-dependent enzyme [Pseudomonadales bacterium]MCP5345657.1 aminotransferase class I/II-fold pyridoxal phosphate-dependent enzyme [Pseudomonadales bacterium]
MNSDPTASQAQAAERLQQLQTQYQEILTQGLSLDLTRGKPSTAQLDLSDALDGILQGDFRAADGTDCRNYGGGLGLPEARKLAANYLECKPEQTLVGGNSSLQLMYQCVLYNHLFGDQEGAAWSREAGGGKVKFLCPSPGYDRHFSVCEALGIEMIPVALNAEGPDMDQVEKLVQADPLIKGIWCVPKYSNPSGIVYSEATVQRLARLGSLAGANFRIIWDNAYAVHHLVENPPELANLLSLSEQVGTLDNVYAIGSTSKITFAGAGIAFLASSETNIRNLARHLSYVTIGPDKVNQLRHVRFLQDNATIAAHMEKQREILKPKFDLVLQHLDLAFTGKCVGGDPIGTWTRPAGGYFILFDTQPGLAREVVRLTGAAGVKLTPAGATWPYGEDPQDTNIRLAPSFPQLEEIAAAMKIFTLCVELATLKRSLEKS